MKSFTVILTTILFCANIWSQGEFKPQKVSANLEIVRLSDVAFVHVSYAETQWGTVASNGLILVEGNKAFLFDTPMDEPTTIELVNYIRDSLNASISGFVPNHWHNDCIGGLSYLHKIGVESYSNKLTAELALKNGFEVPRHIFTDSLVLKLGKHDIFCYFPGAAHSLDNIVVWLPAEKILFGGCMVKETKAKNMGNTADGDLKAWPATIHKVMEKFPDARIVIPGHGQFGGFELLKFTYEMARSSSI